MSLIPAILETAHRSGSSITWADDTGEFTLDAMLRHAAGLALDILNAAPDADRPVALLLPNERRFDLALLACWMAGRVPAPLNPQLPAATLADLCRQARVQLILTVPQLDKTAGAVCAIVPIPRRIMPPPDAALPPPPAALAHVALERAFTRPAMDDTAIILFTSGTQGPNKGVMLTHGNLLRHAAAVARARYYAPGDAVLCTLPKFHCYAILMCTAIPLLTGTSLHIRRRFTPKAILRLISARRLTHLFVVPSMASLLTRAAARHKPDFSSVKLALSGGGVLSAVDRAAFERATGRPLINGYGLTEATSTVASSRIEDNRPGSAGPPVPGVEVEIWNASERALPRGQEGEIMVRGPNVMKGYLGDAEATRRALTPAGWLRTGDWGRLDADNYLYVTGRKKDLIISAGLNIHPREIEDVLQSHPAVAQAAVAGRPDRTRGEAPHAFAVLRDGQSATERDLLAYCASRLAPIMIPRAITILPALPTNALGKVQKHLLPHDAALKS